MSVGTITDARVLMKGNEAIAEAAIRAGLQAYAAAKKSQTGIPA